MGPTEGISSKSLLLGFPNELLLEVGSHLHSFQDLNSLVRSSSVFHKMFNTYLFRRAVAADVAVLHEIVGWVLSRYRLASLTLLLDHGLSVNRIFKSGSGVFRETMLHSLCKLDDPQRAVPLARLLIQRGADIKANDARSSSVLFRAIIRRNCPIVTLLLAHGADPTAAHTKWGHIPLHAASAGSGDNAEMIHLLIAHGAGAHIEARSPEGDTPLSLASLWGNKRVMAALLEYGADAGVHKEKRAQTPGKTPLHHASTWFNSEHHELAKALLEHGANVNATERRGETPLHRALRCNDGNGLFIANFLLENGADINAASNAGLSPLHCALSGQCEADVVTLLLEHGAAVNATDETRRTPLHWVFKYREAWESRFFMAKLLLENGADVNAVSHDGLGPLHSALAVECGADVVTLLLEHGAIINATDEDGRTPLYCLFDSGPRHPPDMFLLTKILLEHGADVNAISHGGLNVLEHAIIGECEDDIITLLVQHGAEVSVYDE
jgi:ankyrin repeat protein